MNRSTLDKLISTAGVVIALVLFAAAGGLLYAHNFIHNQVIDQLSDQKITFPAAGDKSLAALPEADRTQVSKYAGQQLTTGAQAKVFSDNYIAVHINDIGGGKTYSQLSTESRANPSDSALAGKVQTVFRGETLRGMLLNAYAFDTMAVVARYAAFGAIIGGSILLVLAGLGYYHSGRVAQKTTKAAPKKKR